MYYYMLEEPLKCVSMIQYKKVYGGMEMGGELAVRLDTNMYCSVQ